MTKKLLIGIALVLGAILTIWACTKIDARPSTQTKTTQNNQTSDSGGNTGGGGGGSSGGGGDDENPVGTDNFTYLYTYGSNYVRYTPIANKFEKVDHTSKDAARAMIPIDLHSWSIANFVRSKLIFSHFKLKDSQGTVLYEYHDTEGAVHVSLSQNERENNRGNNHQAALSRFLIAEGNYTIEYQSLSNSVGKAYFEAFEQYESNQFRMLIGSNVTGNLQGSIEEADRMEVNPNTTITYGFTVTYGNYSIIKLNANGFEHN